MQPLGISLYSGLFAFVFPMQTYSNLASVLGSLFVCVCVYWKIAIGSAAFPFLHMTCSLLFVCLCFVVTTVHVMNALESNTVHSMVWCHGLVYEL